MPTYLVRTTGSNAANGLTPATAWATPRYALTQIQPGDTLYIGAGVYRDTNVALTASPTNEAGRISLIGDVSGAQTGDAGEVILSGYTTNDLTLPPTNFGVWEFGSRSWLSFSRLTFHGTGRGSSTNGSCLTLIGRGYEFDRCLFVNNSYGAGSQALFIQGVADQTNQATIDRCLFVSLGSGGSTRHLLPVSTTADYDVNILYCNCVFWSNGTAVQIEVQGTPGFKPGGVKLRHITHIGNTITLRTNNANLSTTFPCELYYSFANSINANPTGSIVQDYNILTASSPYTNYTAPGGNQTRTGGSINPALEWLQHLIVGGARQNEIALTPAQMPLWIPNSVTPAPVSTDFLGNSRGSNFAAGAFEPYTPVASGGLWNPLASNPIGRAM